LRKVSVNPDIVSRQEMEVRWGDCDAAGIVYYAKFFDWFSDGRVGLLKQVGLPYHANFHEQGIVMVAIEAHCRYRKSMRPEERFVLETRLAELSRSRMTFTYVITRQGDGAVVAEGKTAHAYVDSAGKPFDCQKRYPALWDRLCEIFAAGN